MHLIVSHDRPIVQGYPDGCQHKFVHPAEAKAPLLHEGASALDVLPCITMLSWLSGRHEGSWMQLYLHSQRACP